MPQHLSDLVIAVPEFAQNDGRNACETARLFAALGEIDQALQIACATEAAKATLGDRCGFSQNNVYVRVNEPVRYVERATVDVGTISETATEHAVEVCSEAVDRSYEACAGGK